MSGTTADLRQKINSAGELRSVVRTMKAVAGASIGQYEQAVHALTDYYRAVELGLGACFRGSEPLSPASGLEGAVHTGVVGALVFGSDQGLVGQFNEVVTSYALSTLAEHPGTPRIWAVGERVNEQLSAHGLTPMRLFTGPSSVQAIAPLIGQILAESQASIRRGDVREVHLFYNAPTAGGGYEPVSHRLLPMDEHWRRELVTPPWPTSNLAEVLGDGETLPALIREYLFISLFRACAESLASENASRLAAMERAERNIDDLVDNLNVTFHRLRQSTIDEELFDVIAGFEAVSEGKLPRLAR